MRQILRRAVLPAILAVSVSTTFAAGQAVASDDVYSPPLRIDNAASAVQAEAVVAVNGAGDAVAVWESANGGPFGTIYGARRPNGASWSAPVALTSDYHGGVDELVLGADGTAYFDAISRDDDGDHILSWTLDGTVGEIGIGGHDDEGRLFAGRNGDLVAYAENVDSGQTTYHFALGGAWTSTTTLSFLGTSQVALAPKHTYYVAYTPDVSGPNRTFRVSKVDGITGKATLLLRRRLCAMGFTTTLSLARAYDIGAGSNGSAVLTWRCRSPELQTIKALRIDAAGHVGGVVQLAQSKRIGVSDPLSWPRVAFDGATATVLFSRAVGGGRRDILAMSSKRGSRWNRPTVKAANVAARSAEVLGGDLTSGTNGAALFTYRNGGTVAALRRAPRGTFGGPVRVFGSSAVPPLLSGSGAITPNGTALVIRAVRNTRLMVRTSSG
jgi:hypothetical protein